MIRMEKPSGSSVNSPILVSQGAFMRPADTPSYSRESEAYNASKRGVESSDPELEKLWRDIDKYCDSDETQIISTEATNLLLDHDNSDEQRELFFKKQRGVEINFKRPTDVNVSLANTNGGKSFSSCGKYMTVGLGSHSAKFRKNCHLPSWIGKRRRLEDTGLERTKSLSLLASSKGSSQTRSASDLGSTFWDRLKHRRCRKTPLLELKSRRNGEMQESNARTFESTEKGAYRLDKEYQNFHRRKSSFSSKECDSIGDRERVKKSLDLFRALCKELLHEGQFKRIDCKAAEIIKGRPDFVDLGKFVGSVPGVDVGDEFRYRMEVALVSLHKPSEAGIDFMRFGTNDICISIVATGCGDYANDMNSSEFLTYCGHGGNVGRARKQPEDQRLEKGNLALKNSITVGNLVRVIRGRKETFKTSSVYIYDGLYTVESFWREKAAHGKLVFMFKLRRILGQPQLSREQWMKLGAF